MKWIVEEKWLAVKKSLLMVLTYRERICQANNLLFLRNLLKSMQPSTPAVNLQGAKQWLLFFSLLCRILRKRKGERLSNFIHIFAFALVVYRKICRRKIFIFAWFICVAWPIAWCVRTSSLISDGKLVVVQWDVLLAHTWFSGIYSLRTVSVNHDPIVN